MTIYSSSLTVQDFEQLFHNHCNITDCVYKGVGGGQGVGWVVEVGGKLEAGYIFQKGCLE